MSFTENSNFALSNLDQFVNLRFGNQGAEAKTSLERLQKLRAQEMESIKALNVKEADADIMECARKLFELQRQEVSRLGLGFEDKMVFPRKILTVSELSVSGFNVSGYSGIDRIYVLENGVAKQPLHGKYEQLKKIWQAKLIAHELKHFTTPYYFGEAEELLHPATQVVEEGIAEQTSIDSFDVIEKNFPEEAKTYLQLLLQGGGNLSEDKIIGAWQYRDGVQLGKISYPYATKLFREMKNHNPIFLSGVEIARFTKNDLLLRQIFLSVFGSNAVFESFLGAHITQVEELAQKALAILVDLN